MEPLKPSYREALKQHYPGLTDETIDRVQGLISQQVMLAQDPALEADAAARPGETELQQLLQKEIPEFASIIRRVFEEEQRQR